MIRPWLVTWNGRGGSAATPLHGSPASGSYATVRLLSALTYNVASMARGIQITFDAGDPHKLARWWVDLLGYQLVDSHDRVARLLADGLVTEADVARIDGRLFLADFVAATDPEHAGPRLFFQRFPEGK
jgi:Glyoxalase-like domain